MSESQTSTSLKDDEVSPGLAAGVHEYLILIGKINKIFIASLQKLVQIQHETSEALLSASDVYSKQLADILKNNKYVSLLENNSTIKFCSSFFDEIKNQGKFLQESSDNLKSVVINPLSELILSQKIIRKSCFDYAESYANDIKRKQEDLSKQFTEYADISNKCSKAGKATLEKGIIKMDNTYNTYLLRVAAVNSMNELNFKHVLPNVLFNCRKKEEEVNEKFLYYIKCLFSVSKENINNITKTFDSFYQAGCNVNNVSDLNNFIAMSTKHFIKDQPIPVQPFIPPSISGKKRASIIIPRSSKAFILNSLTHETLQRRLLSLQQQTNELVKSIADISSDIHNNSSNEETTHIGKILHLCNKEANLNILLKQMELYTPLVMDFLGPQENVAETIQQNDAKKTDSPFVSNLDENGHSFSIIKVKKPTSCAVCAKTLLFMKKGLLCKSCKILIHRRCLTGVLNCEGAKKKPKLDKSFSVDSVGSNVYLSPVKDVVDYDIYDDGFESDEFDENYENSNFYENIRKPTSEENKSESSFDSFSKSFSKSISDSTVSDLSSSSDTLKVNQREVKTQSLYLGTPNANQRETKTQSLYLGKKPAIAPKPPSIDSKKKPELARKPSMGTLNRKMRTSAIIKQPSSPPPPIPTPKPNYCIALYGYESDDKSYLSFTAGAKIKIIENTDSVWWFGEFDSCQGYFPEQYVVAVKENQKALRCLYDFHAENEKEMSVYQNDILVKIADQDDWVLACSYDKQGLVPASYVEYL